LRRQKVRWSRTEERKKGKRRAKLMLELGGNKRRPTRVKRGGKGSWFKVEIRIPATATGDILTGKRL